MARSLAVLVSALAVINPLLDYVVATPVINTAGQVPLAPYFPADDNNNNNLNDKSDTIHLPLTTETSTTTPPSWFESTLLARRLLALSKTGSIASTFPPNYTPTEDPHAGLPITLPEYIADCPSISGEGNPTLLALPISTTIRNAQAGSNLSLALDWWAHVDTAPPVFPGFPPSEAGLPRVTLLGYLERLELSAEEEESVRGCFVRAHPDARAWVPGREGSPHESFWARLVVEGVYWVGGFGGVQRIGWVDLEEWRGVRRDGSGGDGRGWGDVRLPGERE